MIELDSILDSATDPTTGSLHGAVFIVVDRSGKTIYKRASGSSRLNYSNSSPLQINSLYWIASMTKLVTAIAAVQLVERGILDLDSDVREHIEELRDIKVLKEMRGDQPVYEDVQGGISLRQLLTHTSGLVYDFVPLLKAWSKPRGRTAHTFCGSMEGYTHPLLFQPGTSWGYGAGLDWAGVLIERITGRSLSEYMQENIFAPLGITSMTFRHPDEGKDRPRTETETPALLEMVRRVPVPETSPNTSSKPTQTLTLEPTPLTLAYPLKHPLGGIGLFSTPSDFIAILSSLLQGGNELFPNGKQSIELLFAPQIGASSEPGQALPSEMGRLMRRVLGIEPGSGSADMETDHALAGTINMKDIPGRRKAKSICWSGFPNTHWWVDQRTGIAAAFFTQVVPPGDAPVTDLFIALEKAVYRLVDCVMGLGSRGNDLKL